MATKTNNPMKVITGKETRWSYANVWEAKSINGGAPKFSVSLIIPKSDTATVQKIKAAIQAAYEEGQGKLKGNGRSVPPLSAIKNPLRDGDTERPDDPAYCGCRPQPHSGPLGGLLWCIWPRQHHVLRLQLEWQQRHRLRPEQPSEDPRW